MLLVLSVFMLATVAQSPASAMPEDMGKTVYKKKVETKKSSNQKSTSKGKVLSAKAAAPAPVSAFRAALSRRGSSYGYGGVGPSVFDCSGLTRWAYARAGKALPHSSAGQVGRTYRVSKPMVGDLVFFHNGGSVYHVALWAGPGKVFHASRPGTPVGFANIWSSSIFFGRVK